jgi:sporulation protein YlmC with PRC-barrel domain
MKRTLHVIINASAVSLLALSAVAQEHAKPEAARADYAQKPVPSQTRADRLNGAVKASDLIGMTVKNPQEETLGKVNDLAVDVESGRVVQVILSTGGFLGIGDTLTAVPPGALHHDVAQKVLHLDADITKLKSAPAFETSKWAECCDSNHLSAVYGYYGQESALTFIRQGDAGRDGAPRTDGAWTTQTPLQADASQAERRLWTEKQTRIPTARLSQMQKASKLMGMTVKNLQDENLGNVENLLVDLPSGRVVAVIVSSGGFLGIGDALSAVPPTALRFTTERDALQLDASKELLAKAPHFTGDRWPDFADAAYAGGVYRAYNVEPYFATDVTTAADNTARNVRDRDERTLTPLDQGNSKADVSITAQIRKEIVAGRNMSVNAKNVKIITNAGRVTLRGPVNTAEEKRLIGEIAARIARFENVDNQLEVTVTTSSR